MERAMSLGDPFVADVVPDTGIQTVFLDTQYRMHATISDWASTVMYAGGLTAAPEVRSRLLPNTPGVAANETTSSAMLLLDTRKVCGASGFQLRRGGGVNRAPQNWGALFFFLFSIENGQFFPIQIHGK